MALPPEPALAIGRAGELALLATLCPQQPLVTVTGPGGVGKSHLAVSAAHAERRVSGRAVHWCELSACEDESALLIALARALGLQIQQVRGPLADRLTRVLARVGDALLVLDNCEHLWPAVRTLLLQLHAQAESLHVLATSRIPLELPHEHRLALQPLALPAPDRPLHESPAVSLFAARAELDRDDPHLQRYGASVLAATEGLPLSIELAAARVPLLGLRGLAERLHQPLSVLDSSKPRWAARHASLRASIAWSWSLLSEPARAALCRLSLFRGGFPVEVAELAYAEAGLRLLETLHERGLLRLLCPGRFGHYESVRQFALECLDERGERRDAADFQMRYAIAHAERLLSTSDGLVRLLDERENLEQALSHALAIGQAEPARAAMLALGRVLTAQGPAEVHFQLLTQTLALSPADPTLLHQRGNVCRTLGRLADAERDLQHALAHLQPAPAGSKPSSQTALVYKDLGIVYHQRREVDAARRCYEQALSLAIDPADAGPRAQCKANLAALEHDIGRYEAAHSGYEQALAMLVRQGDRATAAIVRTNLAILEQERGYPVRARRHYQVALSLAAESGDRRGEAMARENLAVLCDLEGRLDEGAALHRSAGELLRALGDERSEGLCYARLAGLLAQQGELDAAHAELARAEALLAPLDDPLAPRLLALHRATVAACEGERATALRALQVARRTDGPDARALVALSDDARSAVQVLERLLAEHHPDVLTIEGDGTRLRVGDGPVLDLQAHPHLARIVHALAQRHAETPDSGLDPAGLFEHGWPGERVLPEAAANRLHVALAKLRKAGLSQALERCDSGYRLRSDWLVIQRPNTNSS